MTEPAHWLRRAGHGLAPDGTSVTWSIAEGRRGRRWREVRVREGSVVSSLLLETDPDGQFSHLEVSTPAGLLTLHPEGDGTIHGHSIGAEGLRHVAGLPWPSDGVVLLDASAICLAAAARALRGFVGPGHAVPAEALTIGIDLAVQRRSVGVYRLPDLSWAFDGGDPMEVLEDGVPYLTEASDWPLEE